jgi:Zn-dependent metalloprotease
MRNKSTIAVAVGFALAALANSSAFAQSANSEGRALGHIIGNKGKSNHADGDSYGVKDVIVDADGGEHVRFERTYKGLPVIGGDLVVHSDKNGNLKDMSLTIKSNVRPDKAPHVDEADAIATAEGAFGGLREGASASRLVLWTRGNGHADQAWDVTVTGTLFNGDPSVRHFIVDANNGKINDSWDDIHTAASTGTGNSLISGQVSIGTDSITGGWALRDLLRGSHYVTNMKNRTNGSGTLYTDADNLWGNFSTTDGATVAVDAHFGQQVTWDFYKNVLGRNGIANDGRGAFSRVHYSRNYVNAFWSDACFCMSYGDGDGVTYLPLVAQDVAGHEMTHGVTANTAGLVYSGESGGLNEATSDMMGAMTEFYANRPSSPPNYLIGERIYKSQVGATNPTKALRFMFKPSLDGRSPDCYSLTIGSLDVHYSSGVANHFFYLLAEGAVVPSGFSLTPSQLVCNGNTAVAGVGRDAATKIWYRALSVYMTSNTGYAGARTATLNAASDLYGAASAQRATVAAAWSAVGVN